MSGAPAGLAAASACSPLSQRIRVRKATPDDAHDIVRIACSVGNSNQDSTLGFLVCNYASDPIRFRREFEQWTMDSDHFYVAEAKRVCGFLIAHSKRRWQELTPGWSSQIHWHPTFDPSELQEYVVVDKTAVMAGMTGQGIGSLLYDRLIEDLGRGAVETLFAETVIAPVPNYASLQFRRKQRYELVGMRYERILESVYSTLVYMKKIGATPAD